MKIYPLRHGLSFDPSFLSCSLLVSNEKGVSRLSQPLIIPHSKTMNIINASDRQNVFCVLLYMIWWTPKIDTFVDECFYSTATVYPEISQYIIFIDFTADQATVKF